MGRARVTRLAGHFVIKLTTTENRMLDKDRTKPPLVCRHGPVAGRADHERRSTGRRLDRAVRTQTGRTPSGSAPSRASADGGGMWTGVAGILYSRWVETLGDVDVIVPMQHCTLHSSTSG